MSWKLDGKSLFSGQDDFRSYSGRGQYFNVYNNADSALQANVKGIKSIASLGKPI